MALDTIFAALANPTRRAMLERLMTGEQTVTDLAAPFNLRQPTISAHLKVLEQAGLVTRGRNANQRPVRLAPMALQVAHGWIGQYQDHWTASLDRLESYAKALEQEEKDNARTQSADPDAG